MVSTARTLELVGGEAVVGRDVRHGLDLVRAVREGLPVRAVQHLLDSGRLTLGEIDRVVMPARHWPIGARWAR